ncbi:Hypothetical protein PHPALM_13892 [Phytophthora palmivora]|uniref:Uncharacterized protein n=1 Tax=Phytophthora palmivora TaxID=4796 RepID=A0A2P4XW77_9STRA|nr:Hypothetical protein PHPALM_13892 [Phytophthora palmivora]
MGLDELKPGNTKRAKDTAVTAFKAFVKSEHVEFDYYFRQSKMWLFELFPVQLHIVEAKLLSMGKTLNSFCMKRDGKVVNKAPPCSKSDLEKIMLYLYEKASSASDYQDAALLCLLWYLFGRASDLSLVRKQNLSVDAGKVFFVRFIRMKTSEEQGLSLFPDADFVTCPLHAIAMAIITQTAPTVALIDNLPDVPVATAVNLSPSTPLLEVLNHPEEFATIEPSASPPRTARAPVDTTPTIYTHVNRLLDRVARVAGVSDALTSHSSRRGGAQHVNGCDGLTQCWIFDRGAWNMSTTNKGFNYIFNTSREDHKVSKALSGYDMETKVKALDLKPFDTKTLEKIADVQRLLFTTCYRMESAKYYLSQQSTISKQQKSDAKLLVAFMKLFLDDGFELDTTTPDYRDRVLNLGYVLNHLRSLHRSGILNAKIERYQHLIQTAVIKDPAPGYTQDVLEVISE